MTPTKAKTRTVATCGPSGVNNHATGIDDMKDTSTAAEAATPPSEGTHASEPSTSERIGAVIDELHNALALVEAITKISDTSSNEVRLAFMAAALLNRATDDLDRLDAAMGVHHG